MDLKILDMFAEPFRHWKGNEYTTAYSSADSISTVPPFLPSKFADVKDVAVPDDIVNVYWHFYEQHGGEWWALLGQFRNGAYFYYRASCCYTGFDADGQMHFWLAETLDDAVYFGMDEYSRRQWLAHLGQH